MNRLSPLFTTFDRASESFFPPFVAPHAGVAIRSFTDAINNPNKDTDMSKHPDDFDLYHVGDFDNNTGDVIPLPGGKQLVIQGKQLALSLN